MTPRDARALRWGAVAVIAAVLVLRALPWVARSVSTLRERAHRATADAERARRVLEAAQVVRDSLSHALGQVVALAPRLLDGRSAAEAGATLTGLVTLTAHQQAMRTVHIDPATDSAGAVFARVTVRAELEGDTQALGRWLRAVESHDPLLTVPRLHISALDPAALGTVPERLRIEATVTGLYWPRPRP